jgi:hypothetical protein
MASAVFSDEQEERIREIVKDVLAHQKVLDAACIVLDAAPVRRREIAEQKQQAVKARCDAAHPEKAV